MNCLEERGNRSVQFTLRSLLLSITLTCLAIALGFASGERWAVLVLGAGILGIGLVPRVHEGRSVAADAAIVGALWIGSMWIFPLFFAARDHLHLTGLHSPAEAAWGRVVWIGSIGLFAGLPALAGVFRTRLSIPAIQVAASLFLATLISLATGGPEIPRLVLIQWSGSVLVFVGGNFTSNGVRARSWVQMLGATLLLAFGFLLVVTGTWVPLYLE